MKVAIIGGGLAGIVCALQLERHGINPDIFERNKVLAETYRHAGSALQIQVRPIKDPLTFLDKYYNINITPSGLVKKVIHYSPHHSTAITGDLGYFLIRGSDPRSIDYQLAKNLKCNIYFNTEVDYKDLKKDYDYIVIATGYPLEAKELGIWQTSSRMCVKGAVISGNFSTDTFKVWLNKDYCNSGYAYLIPFSNKEATLAISVSDIEMPNIDRYWDMFVKSEKLDYKIIETFKRIHYSGTVYPHKVSNIYFIGNAAGCLDPLLGFGAFASVITASETAKSIAMGTDYEAGIKSVLDINNKMLEFRKTFNLLDNKDYDHMIRMLGLPGVNPLVYRTNLNVISLGYAALKPLNSLINFKVKIKY